MAADLGHDHEHNDLGEERDFPKETQALIDAGYQAEAELAESGESQSLVALNDTFLLHSNPGVNHTIYLDFDGHVTSGTTWNGGATINSPPYDIDGNASSFSTTELQRIQRIWQRVAEDFAPFEVNVTTEEPGTAALSKSGAGDVAWGTRVVVTDDTWANCGCGGHAYIGSFNDSLDEPVFVYNSSEIGVSAAASHEIGHAVYLSHDGLSSGTTYYNGHGANGTEEEWGPIMGSGYYTNMTTWDNGTYYDANNGGSGANYNRGPDDLQVITTYNGFGFRTDDHGGTTGSASSLGIVGPNGSDPTLQDVDSYGIITQPGDMDMFSFTTGAGSVNLTIDSYVAETHVSQGGGSYTVSYEGTPINNQGSNLDVLATIYDSSGGVVATSNPSGLNASFSNLNLAAGTYYVAVDGTGFGDWAANPPTGYDDYVSLGQYRVTGTVVASNPNSPPTAVNDSETTNEDTSVIVSPLANDSDPDGDTISISSFTQAANGAVTDNGNGTLNYTPDSNFNGSDAFTYTISDGNGGTDTGTVSVTVTPVADISIAAVDADKAEGDSGTTSFTFEITLDQAAASTVSVNWAVDSGGDVDAADFGGVLPSGSESFSVGETSRTISLDVSGDVDIENDEAFTVSLSSPGGGTIATGTANGNIRTDDQPAVLTFVDVANSESTPEGSVSGSFNDTHDAYDGVSESITESHNPGPKKSSVEHTWNVDVSGGDISVTFELIAGHTSSAETFRFEYLVGSSWQTLVTLDSTAMTSYSVAMPTSLSGPVTVRMVDTWGKPDDPVDTVSVDYLAIVSQRTGVPTDQPPTVTVTNPLSGSDVSGAVTVTANASDDDAVTQVEFFVNGTSIGVDTNGGDGWSASWDTALYAEDGNHTVTATATDSASQTSSDSVTVTVDNIDNEPTVAITNPSDGASVSGVVVITANASDDRGVSQVEFFVDGSSIGVDIDGSDGWSVNWDTSGLTDGSAHTIDATVTDSGGSTSSATQVNVTVNQVTQLSVTDITPSTVASGGSVNVTITGTGFATGASVNLENGGGPTPTVSNVVVVDSSTITATISTKDGGPPRNRDWNVRLTNPDSSTAVLVDGFTVTVGGGNAPAAVQPHDRSWDEANNLVFAEIDAASSLGQANRSPNVDQPTSGGNNGVLQRDRDAVDELLKDAVDELLTDYIVSELLKNDAGLRNRAR